MHEIQPFQSRRPPFDATAARRLREALGMAHSHVAYGIWAAYGIEVAPATIAAWELGEESPTEAELTALAGALWCAPSELLGRPSTLREHRMAQGLAAADLAMRIGMDPQGYERIERTGRWTGTDRQAAALAEVLKLPVPAFIEITGRSEALAELLRSAVTTRWQGYVKPVSKLVSLPRPQVEQVMQQLHGDYQSRTVSTLNWGGAGAGREASSGEAGRAFLDGILTLFWELLAL